jgi:uncharacterized protein (TIGR02217 family)
MFHDTRFPTAISRAASGGPERRTDVVVLGSGAEERNARWADSRRAYNAGYGVKSLDDLHAVIAFFEERRGRLHGFRWRDPTDWKYVGLGDGLSALLQLSKTYGSDFNPWTRDITKPVAGTVPIAVAEVVQTPGTHYTVDHATGIVTFSAEHIPAPDAVVTAGFEFDVPVRFDTDKLEINLQGFRHGAIPSIPIVEIRV